jgi:hypothetical protein
MALQFGREANQLLESLGESLDITPAQYELAEQHYRAVGEWLLREGSGVATFEPQIYPQGSFRLGTVVKPINDADEFDIDLVCEMRALDRNSVDPKQLKALVGNRLRESAVYQRMLEEKDRCWRLNYADDTSFHMDVLPAIPDNGSGAARPAGPILITDKPLSAWVPNNPVGYADWFKEKMKVRLLEARTKLAKSLNEDIANIPDYKVKTPLQRAVQILKRDRNEAFQRNPKVAPASIILTTLAAHAYYNEPDIADALAGILTTMDSYIEERNDVYWIENPVNPGENFVECWQAKPELKDSFRAWLDQARVRLPEALGKRSVNELVKSLMPRLGDRAVKTAALKVFPEDILRAASAAPAAPVVITGPAKAWGA